MSLTALELTLGEMRMSGEAIARPGLPLGLEARFEVDTIDLDRILSAADLESSTLPPLVLPAELVAGLDLTIETLQYRGDTVRQVRILGGLEDATATIYEASALMPGGTALSLSGQLADDEAGPRFSGSVRATGDSLPATNIGAAFCQKRIARFASCSPCANRSIPARNIFSGSRFEM